MTGSNRRPSACKADALPAELILHEYRKELGNFLLLRAIQPTIISVKVLNFCVRDGNRCVHFAIITKLSFKIEYTCSQNVYKEKSIGRLVLVNSTPHSAYISSLFTSSSIRSLLGNLILRGASRLDAFSVYPGRT